MKRELGIARCGLACCLCARNETCGGCHAESCPGAAWCAVRACCAERGFTYCCECPEARTCRRGILAKMKPHAFTRFAQAHGLDALLDRLAEDERRGVVYHREGIAGDYDGFPDEEALLAWMERTP